MQIEIMWALLLLYLRGAGAESQQGAVPCCHCSALPCRNRKSQKVHSERGEAGLEVRRHSPFLCQKTNITHSYHLQNAQVAGEETQSGLGV